jgi:vacuolar-type H+-ATPase subunit F/Vma7
MARTSPTQRTLKLLKDEGCEPVAVVERWNQFAQVRQDLFGFIDVLAIRGKQIVAVQATSRSNISSRRRKILGHKNYPAVLAVPNIVIEIHGWDKGTNNRWRVKREIVDGKPETNTED